jgi:cell division protease FtsH
MNEHEYSERVSAEIDGEVTRIMSEALAKAEKIVIDHRKLLDTIASTLIEVETIEREDFEKLLIAHGLIPKKKLDIEHQN